MSWQEALDLASMVAVELDSLEASWEGWMWLCWLQRIWICYELARSFESVFAGSKLVSVDLASLVAVDLDSVEASKKQWIWLRWEQ
jgi:hypothetical protein